MRNVRIGTVSYLVEDEPHSIALNVERGCAYIERAADLGCDVVCLPEMFRTINVDGDAYGADSIPGPTSEAISSAARKRGINVLANWYVSDAGAVYNQTSVFNRDGALVGIYRKVQPTGGEARFIRGGSELPIIELDFGRIAVMTCMDIYFPEIARVYAHKGAEVLFWPTVMHGPTQEGVLAQLRSRAIDNALIVVESNMAGHPPYAPYAGRYRPGTARIIDASGTVLAQTGHREGIAFADVDLDDVRLTSWTVLLREPDHFRADLESITRLDFYAGEYLELATRQTRDAQYLAACDERDASSASTTSSDTSDRS